MHKMSGSPSPMADEQDEWFTFSCRYPTERCIQASPCGHVGGTWFILSPHLGCSFPTIDGWHVSGMWFTLSPCVGSFLWLLIGMCVGCGLSFPYVWLWHVFIGCGFPFPYLWLWHVFIGCDFSFPYMWLWARCDIFFHCWCSCIILPM